MSRRRVIEGADDRGRPRARWEDAPELVEPRFGHMEPAYDATVERRQATADELAERPRVGGLVMAPPRPPSPPPAPEAAPMQVDNPQTSTDVAEPTPDPDDVGATCPTPDATSGSPASSST